MSLEGKNAPDFTLPRNGGGEITLSSIRPGLAVVYFYPRDDTSGCTLEAQGFSDRARAFEAAGATVVGVSKDTVAKHDRFVEKYSLNVILASVADGDVCERYGVWVKKKMYGREFMGIERATFLIGRDGIVLREWRKVKVNGHVDEVLEVVKSS